MSLHIKIDGVWQTVERPYVKRNECLVAASEAWIKRSGAWVRAYEYDVTPPNPPEIILSVVEDFDTVNGRKTLKTRYIRVGTRLPGSANDPDARLTRVLTNYAGKPPTTQFGGTYTSAADKDYRRAVERVALQQVRRPQRHLELHLQAVAAQRVRRVHHRRGQGLLLRRLVPGRHRELERGQPGRDPHPQGLGGHGQRGGQGGPVPAELLGLLALGRVPRRGPDAAGLARAPTGSGSTATSSPTRSASRARPRSGAPRSTSAGRAQPRTTARPAPTSTCSGTGTAAPVRCPLRVRLVD